jgi:HAD hydrolase, family IA, variant 1
MMKLQTNKGNREVKAILFDKDGTLTNIDNMWVEPTEMVIRNILKQHIKEDSPITIEQMLELLGIVQGEIVPNSVIASGTVEDLLDEIGKYFPINKKALYDVVLEDFRQYLLAHPDMIIPIGDVAFLISELKHKGIKVGVVTNDSYIPTKTIFEILKIWHLFDFVATPDEYPAKPASDSLIGASEHLAVPLHEIFYVGDSYLDMDYAKHCGGGIAVLTSGSDVQKMKEQSLLVLDSVEQLLDFVIGE